MNRPTLAPDDVISFPLEVDINTIVADIVRQWSASPVVHTEVADTIRDLMPQTMPGAGESLSNAVKELLSIAGTYLRRNAHPGFYGYVASPGLPTDPLAHAITAAFNQNVVGYSGAPGAASIERTVIEWLHGLTGFPAAADGVLLGGGSLANLAGLAAALYDTIGEDAVRTGLSGVPHRRPVILAPASVHFSIRRAAVLLGIGQDQVHCIDVDSSYRMSVDALRAALSDARQSDDLPCCVVASAGTTTTGAVDPLDAVADVCEHFDVWLHVDAAYGGAGLLAPGLRPLFAGLERAHSVAMDLHKWFYLAFDGSVVLYRDPDAARRVFFIRSDYVQFERHGPAEEHMFFHLGPEVSRRARALAAYLAFRYYGAERLGRNIQFNADCAAYLASLVDAAPDLELVSPAVLSICCFRFAPTGCTDHSTIDNLNRKIRDALEESGEYYLSRTDIDGRPVLRVCVISHTTRAEHMERLVDEVLRLGRFLLER